MKKYLLFLLLGGLIVVGCNKNDDGPAVKEENKEKPKEEPKVRSDYPVQDFMWQAMNFWYFWQADVADLADDRFATLEQYVDYLSKNNNPEAFFYRLCKNHVSLVGDQSAVDRFSFVAENYKDLVNVLQGVSKSNGLEFQLVRFSGSDDIFGVVTYIALGSNAATKEIKRGDIFIGVNGQTLTINNYIDLLFGDLDTYKLTMASISGNTISENGKEVTLTKVENFSENPVLISKVLEVNGIKVGYLMYTGFLAAYDDALNQAFGTLKSAGISELVLDLRYNGGGRVSSAVQIASTIYGTKTDELFLRTRYNNKIQSTLKAEDVETNFTATTLSGAAINALNLQKAYVITSNRTASASEMVINGLEPYLDVIQIGEATTGKNEFSFTFVDDVQNSYLYDSKRENNIKANSQWGIQPLLGRNENADGFSDYTSGLRPDHVLEEDITNLGVLGDPQEPLLALTLDVITGQTGKSRSMAKVDHPWRNVASSIEFKPSFNKANMDGLLRPRLKATE